MSKARRRVTVMPRSRNPFLQRTFPRHDIECHDAIARLLVRAEGLEPPRLSPLVPKTSASTNSATPADPIALRASKRSAAIVGPRCYTHFERPCSKKMRRFCEGRSQAL
jgi:hypothetical protein